MAVKCGTINTAFTSRKKLVKALKRRNIVADVTGYVDSGKLKYRFFIKDWLNADCFNKIVFQLGS